MITFDHVYNVFGPSPSEALARLDRGESRDLILEQTGNLIATVDASVQVLRGEILVLMGLSGSGKSTLLRCANALVRPVRGHVLYQDERETLDLTVVDEKTLRRIRMSRISMVFQRFALLPWRTLRQNVAFGLEVRGLKRREVRRIVDEKLELVGLGQWKDKYTHELSGGMQQRVGLARALATDPDVLLLDEPFSALDPLIRLRMQTELLTLQRELKKTMIFVSHDLDEALRLGSRVAIMEAGHIVQVGTPEQIVMNPGTDYVRQFVAHVNPLNVLRSSALMRPHAELDRDRADPTVIRLEPTGHHRCRVDAEGRPVSVWAGERPGRIVAYVDGMRRDELVDGDLVAGSADLPMRAAIEVNHVTGRPLLVVDSRGKLIGVISAWEILRGLLERPTVGNDPGA
ncbi:MAG: ATP-binding cassette domain-containing protein [Candidatus Riflebacteria bacterium]|nr:ATP-binding cassette domain-containing protein [Candidatus Riflebacteria bacterium]